MIRRLLILFLMLITPSWCLAALYQVKQSSTAYPLVFQMIDSTDHTSGKTGLTVTVTLSKSGASFGAASGAVTEIASGWYKVAGNATDTGTLGPLILHATATGADTQDFVYEVVAVDPQSATAFITGVNSQTPPSSWSTLVTQVWAAGTRTLTAGTNIALAKGTGVTGFNDIAATDVWAATTRTLSAGTNITLPNSQSFSTSGSVGSVGGNVGGNVVGNVNGNLNGNVVGDIQGTVQGDVLGNIGGSVIGDIQGNIFGNVQSDVLGSVQGNIGGSLSGNVGGDLLGNVSGSVVGDVVGNVQGSVGGDIVGSVGGTVNLSEGGILAVANHTYTLSGTAGSSSGLDTTLNSDAYSWAIGAGSGMDLAGQTITFADSSGQVCTRTIVSNNENVVTLDAAPPFSIDSAYFRVSPTSKYISNIKAKLPSKSYLTGTNTATGALAKTTDITGFNDIAATDVWAAGTRTLSSGANIALAKGTGVTGFNDLSAAQVNAEADTALADVGLTSTITGRIDAAISSRLPTSSYTAAPTATDIWAAGTRTLTAGTNIILPNNSITANSIASDAFTSSKIATGTFATRHFQGDALASFGAKFVGTISVVLSQTQIELADSIAGTHDGAGSGDIITFYFANGEIETRQIASTTADSGDSIITLDSACLNTIITGLTVRIFPQRIGASSLAANTITSSKIATDAIGASQIAAGAITSSEAPNLDAAISTRLATSGYTVPPSVNQIWNEPKSSHTTSGTFGYNLDAPISGVGGTDTPGTTTLLSRLTNQRAINLDNISEIPPSINQIWAATPRTLTDRAQFFLDPANVDTIVDHIWTNDTRTLTSGGSGGASGGGVLHAQIAASSLTPDKFFEIVQGEEKEITFVVEADGRFDNASATAITVKLADASGHSVTIPNADVTRVAEELDIQVFRVTLTPEQTASLKGGLIRVEISFDTQKAVLTHSMKIVESL